MIKKWNFYKTNEILWGYVTSIFRAEMSNCHISRNILVFWNIFRYSVGKSYYVLTYLLLANRLSNIILGFSYYLKKCDNWFKVNILKKWTNLKKNVTLNCHIPRRNVTIHISNKTRIWEHYVKNPSFVKKRNFVKNRNFVYKRNFVKNRNLVKNRNFVKKRNFVLKRK